MNHRAAQASPREELEKELSRLKRVESMYADAQNVAQLGMWEWDVASNEVSWSLGLYRIYGLDPKSHKPGYQSYLRLVHPDDRQRVARVIERAAADLLPFSHDERVVRPDGALRYLHTWGHPVTGSNGRATALIGICQDVTETTLAREAERRGYALLQAVVDGSPQAIFLKDLGGRFLMINGAGAALLGRRPSELMGAREADVLPPDETEQWARVAKEVLATSRTDVREIKMQVAGTDRILLVTNAVWRDASGLPAGIVGTAQDITERTRAEEQRDELLRLERQARLESEAARKQLEFLAEAGKTLSSSLDFEETIRRVVRACVPAVADWCSVFTVKPDGGIAYAASAHADPQIAAEYAAFLETHPPAPGRAGGHAKVIGSGSSVLETVVTPRNIAEVTYGEEHQRLLHSYGLTSAMIVPIKVRDRILGGVGYFSGGSGRRFLESDLRMAEDFARQAAVALENARLYGEAQRSEERYRRIVHTAVEGIIVLDLDGRIEFVNDRFCAMIGWTSEELAGREAIELVVPEDRPCAREARLRPPAQGDMTQRELRMVRKDGAEFPVLVSDSPWRAEDGRPAGLLCMITDLSARKKLETQLYEAQRLEAVGRLAGGVAHDFNNVLTVILGVGEALKKSLDASDPRRANVDELLRAAQSAAGLTRQLLAFGRVQVLKPAVIVINDVITDLQPLLRRVVGESELVVRLDPGLDPARVDPGQLEQVLINLAANARDAMPHGGRLTLETSNAVLGETEARSLEVPPGRWVKLTASDTGHGIAPEILLHLFEPFFTTKAAGKGTGLGLSTVYGIVKQSGGAVRVHSEEGRGSLFEVLLPSASEEGTFPRPERAARRAGSEVVLLVEDDAAVRSVASRALSDAGYKVLAAAEAVAALKILDECGCAIDILVTDVFMPGMDGVELGERIAALCPGSRTLYITGYAEDPHRRDALAKAGRCLLQKPFTPDELAARVRAVLDEPND